MKTERRDDTLNLRVPSARKADLERLAERDGVTMSDIVVPFLPAVIEGYKRSRGNSPAPARGSK